MLIISFEGIDGSGKTTIAKLVFERIVKIIGNRKKVLLTQEPFTKEITSLIEKLGWKDPIALTLLFSADRAFHINWILKEGYDIILMDRYIHSTIAYQSVLGVDEEWIRLINSNFPKPDIVILLDIKPETALERLRGKVDKFNFSEKLLSLSKVREKYLELSRKERNFKVINAERELNEIVEEVWNIIYSYLNF
ncbi:MAG: dTMP kinase [Sulfolobaceae archaeon]|jgi:dTMP kinase|nr:dTMP kinase [Sulfolobaceae archaeon]